MTDTNQTPEPTPAETPTAPLPMAPETAPVTNVVPPAHAEQPAPPAPHHHGVHVPHKVSEGAIAAMVIGAVLFAMLSFGLGWTARGVALRFEAQRAGMMGQAYGRGFGGVQGAPGFGQRRGGMMRGYGQGRGQNPSNGWQGVPNGAPGYSAPNGSAPTTSTN
ncbi:MAG TPA: hypothetical protein VIL41_08120 [Coriobacteriia bacterium]